MNLFSKLGAQADKGLGILGQKIIKTKDKIMENETIIVLSTEARRQVTDTFHFLENYADKGISKLEEGLPSAKAKAEAILLKRKIEKEARRKTREDEKLEKDLEKTRIARSSLASQVSDVIEPRVIRVVHEQPSI